MAGEDWRQRISDNLETADIILLLVRPDFIASDYCDEMKMTRALARHDEKTAVVIPFWRWSTHQSDLRE